MAQNVLSLDPNEQGTVDTRAKSSDDIIEVEVDPGENRGAGQTDPPVEHYRLTFEKLEDGSYTELDGSPVEVAPSDVNHLDRKTWYISDFYEEIRITVENLSSTSGSIEVYTSGEGGGDAVPGVINNTSLFEDFHVVRLRDRIEDEDGNTIVDATGQVASGSINTGAAYTWSGVHTHTAPIEMQDNIRDDQNNTIYDYANQYVPLATLEADSVTVTAGDGLKSGGQVQLGSSVTLDIEPGDFAGTGLVDDGSDNLTPSLGNGIEFNSGNIRVNPAGIAGNALTEESATALGVASGGIQTNELDLSITPTWTGKHTFAAGVTVLDDQTLGLGMDDNFRWQFDSTNTRAELVSTDIDGAGAAGDVMRVPHAATPTVVFPNGGINIQDATVGVQINGTQVVGAQEADFGALTDNTGGTADDTVASVSGSGADSTINNNFADLASQINDIRTVLRNHGLVA